MVALAELEVAVAVVANNPVPFIMLAIFQYNPNPM